MSHLVTSNATFLKILYSADPKQRKALLKTMTENQQQALCEVILNVYKGTFPITKYYIRKLSPYRSVIHRLSSKTVKRSVKRKLLLQNYLILPILIKPSLGILNDVSGVTSTTKRKVRNDVKIKRRTTDY